MESQLSIPGYSNEVLTVLEMKRINFLQKVQNEELAMSMMMVNDEQLRRWAISVGAMNSYETCPTCGAAMQIKQEEFSNEEWTCTSENPDCEIYKTDEKFCFDMDLPMSILIGILLSWYRNHSPEKIISVSNIDYEDYSFFNDTLNDVCMMTCVANSRRIGGSGIRVNVEVGRRGGCDNDSNHVVICGVCDDDDSQFFFVVLNSDNPHYLEVRAFLNKWLLPGSIVFSNSEGYEFINEMKWNKKPNWSLIVRSECLARDFWIHIHQHSPNTFEEFVLDVLEYSNQFQAMY